MDDRDLPASRAGLRHATDRHQRAAIKALRRLTDGLRSMSVETTAASDRCISVVVYNDPEATAGHEAGP